MGDLFHTIMSIAIRLIPAIVLIGFAITIMVQTNKIKREKRNYNKLEDTNKKLLRLSDRMTKLITTSMIYPIYTGNCEQIKDTETGKILYKIGITNEDMHKLKQIIQALNLKSAIRK